MVVFLIVGQKRRGKSTRAMQIAEALNLPIYCYDVNREWGQQNVPPMNEFLTEAQKKTGHTIVFEEATVFLHRGKNSDAVIELLVRTRHTKNVYILLFHSLNDCPNYIVRLADYMVLFYTQDSKTYVMNTFKGLDSLINAYIQVQEDAKSNFHARVEIGLN